MHGAPYLWIVREESYKICGFHSDDNSSCGLWGCDAVNPKDGVSMVLQNVAYLTTSQHGVTAQKTTTWILLILF